MKLRNRLLNFAACAAALVPGVASAVPVLPEAVYIAALATSVQPMQEFHSPGTYTLAGASTTVDGSPALAGHVRASSNVIESVESIIHYGFAVVGPVGNIAVPTFVSWSVDASASGPLLTQASVFSQVWLENGFGGSVRILATQLQASNFNPQPGRISATLPFTAIAGGVYGIWMQIDLNAAGAGAVAYAFVDPYLFVDPTFLASNPGYSVMVSPGIGNTAPVPEPSAALLLGSGLVALLAGRHRFGARKKRPLRRNPSALRNCPGIGLGRMPMGHRRFRGEQ